MIILTSIAKNLLKHPSNKKAPLSGAFLLDFLHPAKHSAKLFTDRLDLVFCLLAAHRGKTSLAR
jgi:hypothetical protein